MCLDYPYLKGKKILVVDDEDMLREFISIELKEVGATCVEASSGIEAFDILQKNNIDFIVSDIKMPKGSGIDLLKDIKASRYSGVVPIVMMSGFSDLSIEQAKSLGAITIVSKPFMLNEILSTINEVLSQQKDKKKEYKNN